MTLKAAGIIVEYNPFHNGHAYHLSRTRELTNADVIIAVMSGPFLQRGEPALLPKWFRAEMALKGGADLVVELPYPFATQKADTFAFGAVSILSALGCDFLCFGSESGKIDLFTNTLDFLENNDKALDDMIQQFMKKGISYPAAVAKAFHSLKNDGELLDLTRPNNILGLAYLKALRKINSQMAAITITRTKAGYHDEHFSSSSIASATSIRKALFSNDGNINNIEPFVPSHTYQILREYQMKYKRFHSWENYWPYLKFRLLQMSPEELSEIYEVEEGLEHRLIRLALNATSFQDFMNRLKTKRYTWTRLQRVCVHILTNTKKTDMASRMNKLSFMRLLGMTDQGRKYLNAVKSNLSVPLIAKLSSFKDPALNLDLKASRIYALGARHELVQELLGIDFSLPPLYIQGN